MCVRINRTQEQRNWNRRYGGKELRRTQQHIQNQKNEQLTETLMTFDTHLKFAYNFHEIKSHTRTHGASFLTLSPALALHSGCFENLEIVLPFLTHAKTNKQREQIKLVCFSLNEHLSITVNAKATNARPDRQQKRLKQQQ